MKELLQSLLNEGVQEGCFPSAAAAVGCGETVFATAVAGRISLPDGPLTTVETRYDMASCSKILSPTILALMVLEKGLLTLDDTVGDYFPAPDATKDITIRQLMTHTSGINPHILLEEQTDDPKNVLNVILNAPTVGESGVPRYSCMGYIVLGKILEKVYGDTLDKLAQKYVFGPLHMTHTCYCPTGETSPQPRLTVPRARLGRASYMTKTPASWAAYRPMRVFFRTSTTAFCSRKCWRGMAHRCSQRPRWTRPSLTTRPALMCIAGLASIWAGRIAITLAI